MKLGVEVISTEVIKPSSPTPDHLRHYKLSHLDQIQPPMYTSTVLFYPNETTTDFDKLNLLKQSLSQVLPHFYPMAGCLIDNLFVDCNDRGALFHESRVNCQLSQFLQDLVPGELTKLIPFQVHGDADFLTGIQVNVFQCGGIGLGVCVSHSLGDAVSYFSFVNSWAAVCRGEREFHLPDFKLSSLFPAKQINNKRIELTTEPDMVAKIFVFSDAAIMDMKEKYFDRNNLNRPPSRVGALSAFIWSRLVAADSQLDLKSKKIYMMGHNVNMRPRIDPPLTQTSFGNCVWYAAAFPGSENEIVSCFNDSVNKIDNSFIKKLQEGILDEPEHSSGAELVGFYFTSLCRFPIYEADFGWNQPVRVCLMPARACNFIPLLDTKSGDGIEAYVNLKKDCMSQLEHDPEFLKFVSDC